ncbi:NUDIX domain-containing protein [Clostridium sp. MSJ-4]|uniref:NUDIX domain-containing protein n=1 Tax=Clostridium simiarum TaxID=2841506 RepID=A0ABS6F3W3_9CLOT|nr:NUDIX domain-containing protein [Clostridium simiarum]MBU5593095.1 NUDIX domain-containing protein [Clostridium simiarum]
MIINRTITSSVYVIYEDKVLLHKHKNYNTLFPLGGKMNENEVPHETALREVYEESGLRVELYNRDTELSLGRVVQLHTPMHTLLENVGHEIENIDFIYFSKSLTNEVKPQKGESKELYWFTKEEIESNDNIKPHVKAMALDALRILSSI